MASEFYNVKASFEIIQKTLTGLKCTARYRLCLSEYRIHGNLCSKWSALHQSYFSVFQFSSCAVSREATICIHSQPGLLGEFWEICAETPWIKQHQKDLCMTLEVVMVMVCTHVCLILLVLFSTSFSLVRKKAERSLLMCPLYPAIISACKSICTGLKVDVFSSELLNWELCFISLYFLLCNASMQNSPI